MFKSPRGTRDLLPEDQPYWQFVIKTAIQKAELFGFDRIDLPMFEDKDLFLKAVGTATDIAEKELFSVSRDSEITEETKEDANRYVLRPEGTAGVVRAYLQHGMVSLPQPVKLYYEGPFFRYERPQKGRYRQFKQFGVELLGDDNAAADALVILMAWEIFTALGIQDDLVIDINSLGDKNCRPKIRKALTEFFAKHKNELCEDCKRRLVTNPLRLLDCKNSNCEPIKAQAPQIIDLLDEDCKNHFKNVLEFLDALDIPYELTPYLVRGLDYYTRTTFEFRAKNDERRQGSIAAGGRYDNLVELYEGKPTPAIGFGLGLDRIVDYLKEKNIPIPSAKRPDVCIIQLGDKARQVALNVVKEITGAGFSISIAPGKDALKGQLSQANKVNAKLALIIGQMEANNKTIIIKNLDDSSQETVPRDRLLDALKKKLLTVT